MRVRVVWGLISMWGMSDLILILIVYLCFLVDDDTKCKNDLRR